MKSSMKYVLGLLAITMAYSSMANAGTCHFSNFKSEGFYNKISRSHENYPAKSLGACAELAASRLGMIGNFSLFGMTKLPIQKVEFEYSNDDFGAIVNEGSVALPTHGQE